MSTSLDIVRTNENLVFFKCQQWDGQRLPILHCSPSDFGVSLWWNPLWHAPTFILVSVITEEVRLISDGLLSLAGIHDTLSHIRWSLYSPHFSRNVSSDLDTFLFLLGVWNKMNCELLLRLSAESPHEVHKLCCWNKVHHPYICGHLTSVQILLVLENFIVWDLLSVLL